jgi:hypothetical protein
MTQAREFQRLLKGAFSDEVLIPILRALLTNPRFDGFEVPIPDFRPRRPDGWFHPSTHPLWPERMLWWYLVAPERLLDVELDTDGAMATTQGTFWHSFLQHVMLVHGLVLIMNPEGRFPHDKVEFFVSDEEHGARGAMDGVLNPDKLPLTVPIGLEIKTMRPSKLNTCPKGGPKDPARLEWLKKKCPEYYAQAQEYLRMSGYTEQRFLFIGIEYPFYMLEISVPFSYGDSQVVVDKYRRVRQAVAGGYMPDPCCTPKSTLAKQCTARGVCPVGMM